MALEQQITDEMKAALLGGNRFTGDTLRNLRAAILDEKIASGSRDEGLSDERIQEIIAREIKKRIESARIYRENDRAELAENEDAERGVLESFMPARLTEEELAKRVSMAIDALGTTSPKDMGRVIGLLKAELGVSVDGAMLADAVKKQLTIRE